MKWLEWLGDFLDDLEPDKPFQMAVLRSQEETMTDERDTLQTGIPAEQIDQETQLANSMHEQRLSQGDAAAALQSVRQQGGDVQNLGPEAIQALFNPDGNLSQAEIQQRIAWYQQHRRELNQIPGQINMHVGIDPETGQQRMAGPGELVRNGTIIMVHPDYAAEVAQRLQQEDPRRAKQNMRRSEALRTLAQVVLNPVTDPTGVQFIHLDDQQYGTLRGEYHEAKNAGISDSELDFLPLYAYAHKLWPPDGAPLRPKISNECGFFQMASNPGSNLQGKIACLRSADLTPELRTQVQVPVTPAPLTTSATQQKVMQAPTQYQQHQPAPVVRKPRRKSNVIVNKEGYPIGNQTVMEPVRNPNMFGKAGVNMKSDEHRMQPAAIQPSERLDEEMLPVEEPPQRYVSVEPTEPLPILQQPTSQPSSVSSDPLELQGLPPSPRRR
jgi:hypothetical protein